MSRPLSSTDNLDGLLQKYEEEIGADPGFVSGNATRAKKFISATRSAWDKYLYLAFKSAGTHQFDDSNHTDFPFIEADLVQNQRDYSFSTDEQGNLILDVFKVMVKDSDGRYFEAKPIDQQRKKQGESIWNEVGETGTPTKYDKTGSSLIFDVLPDYSWRQGTEGERGVKMFINRESSYFQYSDLAGNPTKRPGCPGIHHDYFWLRPAYEHAARHSLSNYADLRDRVKEFEGDERTGSVGLIENYYSMRIRDERKVMTMKRINHI